MTEWRKTVVLKDLLSEDSSDEITRVTAKAMATRLKKLSEYDKCTGDYELELLVNEFEDIAKAETINEIYGGRFTLCDWFNKVLSSLYDWADRERIWIG